MPDMDNATVGRIKDAADAVSDSTDSGSKKKKKKFGKSSSDDVVDKGDAGQQNDVLDDKPDNGDGSDGNGSDSSDVLADNDSDGSDKKSKDNPMKTMSKVGSAVQGAQAAHKAILFAKFIQWLKMMLQMLQQMIAAAVQAVVGFIQTIVTAIVNVATTVAAALGVSVVATLFGGVVAVALVVGLVVGAVVAGMQANEIAKLDDSIVDCSDTVEFVQENVAGDVDAGALQLEYAQKIYSFYHEFGAPDEHIAGILGNWTVESGIDPTRIECDYIYCTGEPYVVGPKKAEAFADLSDYTLNKVFPAYDRSGVSLNKPFYQASDGKYYCGLGLGQWTGENGLKLVNAAKSVNMEWYSLDFQLVYTIMDGGYRVEWLIPWFRDTVEPNAESAAFSFTKFWEGNVSMGIDARKSNAAGWMVRFADWEIDADYANSLIELAGTARIDASNEGLEDALDDCQSERYMYDNSSIATAAVSYAWPRHDQGTHNNGTLLYQCVHDHIFGRGGYYASCCRGGSVAVRWSGSDDTFPAGGCAPQFAYCTSSTKWERVCDLNGMSYADICETLAPGDVLICDSCHTLVWTGHELIAEIHGEDSPSNYVAVEASYGNKSPVCIPLWDNYYNGAYSNNHGGPHHFIAWRCVQPDRSDTYKNAADGAENYQGSSFDPNRYP